MRKPRRRPEGAGPSPTKALKLLGVAVCGMLVGLGLCGIDDHLYPHSEFGGSVMALIGAGLLTLGGLLGVTALLALLVIVVMRVFTNRS
jgi:hypothetical protein